MNNQSLPRFVFGVTAAFVAWDILRGVSTFVVAALSEGDNLYRFQPLSWTVIGRTIALSQLGQGLIEGALLLLIVWWVRRRSRPK
jgi:hypothetical protein